jgi:hypothetical protein
MDRKYSGSSIPRFTKAHMDQMVEEFGDFKLTENVTLKEIIKKTRTLSFLPLEEASHEVWTFGRIVCLGDAIHKMTPNVSQVPFTYDKPLNISARTRRESSNRKRGRSHKLPPRASAQHFQQ